MTTIARFLCCVLSLARVIWMVHELSEHICCMAAVAGGKYVTLVQLTKACSHFQSLQTRLRKIACNVSCYLFWRFHSPHKGFRICRTRPPLQIAEYSVKCRRKYRSTVHGLDWRCWRLTSLRARVVTDWQQMYVEHAGSQLTQLSAKSADQTTIWRLLAQITMDYSHTLYSRRKTELHRRIK